MIASILDQDFYKLTMQQAVLELYPNTHASYRFINRHPGGFTPDMAYELRDYVKSDLVKLSLKEDEYAFLRDKCQFLKPWYLEYLKNYKYKAEDISVNFDHISNDLDITVSAPWHRGIMWEVPVLAMASEIYFKHKGKPYNASDYYAKTIKKGRDLADANCIHFEFGTRRRRSYETQKLAIDALRTARSEHNNENTLFGVSNVHFAQMFNLRPIGTMAHEWIMAHSVLSGLRHANRNALDAWAKVYRGDLGIALTDTYGTKPFWGDFDTFLAKLFDGVRHDSGDPFGFATQAINHYNKLKIDPKSKIIVFSDSLNTRKAIELKTYCGSRIKSSFGIGTHFTNDVPEDPALNIVMKLDMVDGEYVVKLGEDTGKATGNKNAISIAMQTFYP